MKRVPHTIDVIDAAWRLDATEPAWLESIVRAAAPALDVGLGVHGLILDLSAPAGPVRTPVLVGGTDDWQGRWRNDWWENVVRIHPAAAHLAATAAGPLALASTTNERFLSSMTVWQAYAKRLTVEGYFPPSYGKLTDLEMMERGSRLYPETLYVGGLDKPGHAVVLCVNLPSSRGAVPTKEHVRVWARAAAHLGAALRLRRAIALKKAAANEAVLEPSGKLVHAEGPATSKVARAALREAVVAIDRARATKGQQTELERLERWRALNAGRWSLLDSFERDGRRYVVAKPNAPEPQGDGRLTLRERQVLDYLGAGHANKLIAYELGISTSSVSTHIRRLATKLSAASTADLIRMARSSAETPRVER